MYVRGSYLHHVVDAVVDVVEEDVVDDVDSGDVVVDNVAVDDAGVDLYFLQQTFSGLHH